MVNRIEKLSGDETRLIRKSLPNVDLSRVLILEEGREPTSGRGSALLFFLSALCAAAGVGCLAFWKRMGAAERRRQRRVAREEVPEEIRPAAGERAPGRRRRRRR